MKYVFVLFACAFLSACGGGGGGNLNTNPDDQMQMQIRGEAENLRTLAAELPESSRLTFLARIDSAERNISDLRLALNQLEMLRMEIQIAIQSAKMECNNQGMILQNGACRSCAGATPRRVDNSCFRQLTIADCNNQNMILQNGACHSCTGATPRREGNQCMAAQLTMDDCNRQNMILENGACRSCAGATPRRVDNSCFRQLTIADCSNQNMILKNGACRSCTGATPMRVDNQCMAAQLQFTCGDGSVFDNQRACEFRTAEYGRNGALNSINPLYAYERRFFGQGITVAVVDVSGARVTHQDLAANALTFSITVRTQENDARLTDGDGPHGTWVAGLIAASRNDIGGHGVAPLSKFIPFRSGGDSRGRERYIAENNIPIVNRSYFSRNPANFYTGQFRGVRYVISPTPNYRPFDADERDGLIFEANIFGDTMENSDTVNVWSAGNEGWHTENASVQFFRCPNQNSAQECGTFQGIAAAMRITTTVREFIDGFMDEKHGELRTINISVIAANRSAYIPLERPALEDNWLVVAGLGEDGTIGGYSNGCSGAAKEWCLVAPGTGVYTTGDGADDNYINPGAGTSFSAPLVSGALALLKNAAPEMPMTVIRAVLLTTATDLGDSGVDDIYGHGLVNISEGIRFIDNLKTAPLARRAPVPLSQLRGQLPPGFGYLHPHLEKIEIAIKMGDGWYYNMPLPRMLAAGADSPPKLGGAANRMLSENNAGESGKFGVLRAFGGSAEKQFGLRWRGNFFNSVFRGGAKSGGFGNAIRDGFDNAKSGGFGGIHMVAEISRGAEKDGFFGADFGALGAARTQTNAGRIYIRGEAADGAALFGEYGYADIRTNAGGGFIADIRGAKADSWTAGVEFLDMWKKGGKLRFSAAQKTALGGGEMVLRYPHATGDFHEGFKGKKQELETREVRIPLAQKPPIIYAAGYVYNAGKSRWSAAAEYDAGNRRGALSAKLKINL